MLAKLQQIFKAKDIRNNILFVLALLIVFRIAAHIPVPGINVMDLREVFAGNEAYAYYDNIDGGEHFSLSYSITLTVPWSASTSTL